MASMFRAVKYEHSHEIPKEGDQTIINQNKKKKRKKGEEEEDEASISDRVFVCLGRAKEA